MVIGPDWLWLHFPKCGGTSAEVLLRKNFGADPAVEFDPLDESNVIWHENIAARQKREPGFTADGKRIIANLRRLPQWMLSRVHFEAARPPHQIASRAHLCQGKFVQTSGNLATAEAVFQNYNSSGVETWLKVEGLHEEFERFFGRSLVPIKKRQNVNRIAYIKDIDFWFTKQELEELYHSAPGWAAAERALYGDLMV